MEGVVKLLPVNNELPPVSAANHWQTLPDAGVAPKLTVPSPQRLPSTRLVGAAGAVFTLIVTATLLALSQPVAVLYVLA